MNMKLEVVVVPVSDVDRAKASMSTLGFRMDVDHVGSEDFRREADAQAERRVVPRGRRPQRGGIERIASTNSKEHK